MPASPWKAPGPAAPGREYLILLSYLPLRRFRDFPTFVGHDVRVTRQLRDGRGLIGYSKLGPPWVKRFWTLSAWEDESALAAFVLAGSHSRAMADMPPRMGPTRFIRWSLPGSALPRTGTTPSADGAPPSRRAPPGAGLGSRRRRARRRRPGYFRKLENTKPLFS